MIALIYLLMITVPPGGASCPPPSESISLENFILEATSRAIFQYCIATTPSSEELVQSENEIGTSPKQVAAKYCHSSGPMTRLESSVIDILDAADDFRPTKKAELEGYHFIMSLSELVKTGHFRSARKNIGQALAKAHRKFVECEDPTSLFRISETLFDQVRATTGNLNFAHLIGIRSVQTPTIVLNRKLIGNSGIESVSRDVVEITTTKPVAIFNSALEHRVKVMDLAVSNHVDISHSILFREVMRDAQPGSTVFIVTSSRVPSINEDFMSAIGAAQASKIKISIIALDDEQSIGGRSLELYRVLAKFTNGRLYRIASADLSHVVPLIELSLTEGQASVLSRASNKDSALYHVSLDSTLKSLTIEAFCIGGGSPKVVLESHDLLPLVYSDSLDFSFFLVREINIGRYALNISCPSKGVSVEVRGETSVQFRVLNTDDSGLVVKSLSLEKNAKVEKTTIKQGHTRQHFAVLEDLNQSVRLKKSGSLITLPEEEDDDLPFFPDFIIPKALDLSIIPQLAQVDATGDGGEEIHREEKQFLSHIKVEGDVANMDFQPGETATIRLRVHNRKTLLHLTATDFEGWVSSITPTSTSPEDEYTSVEILVTAPNDVKIGSETSITVTARDDFLISVDSSSFSLSVGQTENPTVKKMVVDTNIDNRFGRTIVQSKVQNSHPTPRDAVFSVFLPDSAFITSYKLYIRNHTYQGEIIDPVHADKKTDWLSPSTVVPDKNDDHEWKVKVRMDSWDEALFELVYDEPMSKTDGKHPYHVNLQGKQPIEELDFKVSLYDSDGIADVHVINTEEEEDSDQIMSRTQVNRPFGGGLSGFGLASGADIKIDETKKSAKISFSPSASIAGFSRGLAMGEGSSGGAGGAESLEGAKFEMEYSTETNSAEDFCTITADGEYFVQFCDPPVPSFVNDSSSIGKYDYHVTFVIDTSGSMFGEKLKASVDGILAALRGLTPADRFNIVSFSRSEDLFSESSVAADEDSISRAAAWLMSLRRGGVSSIMSGVQSAIAHTSMELSPSHIPLIVIVTDSVSDATEENFQIALNSISNSAAEQISISSLAVGYTDSSSWQFLQRLSTRNRGVAYRLFDLTQFETMIPEKVEGIKKFASSSRTLARSLRGLTDVHFSFNSESVSDLTDTSFSHFTAGEDLVVLGKFVGDAPEFLDFTIEYRDVEDNLISFTKSVGVSQLDKTGDRAETIAKFSADQSDYNPIRQQWAVTAVHQLLKRRAQANNQVDFDELTKQAAKLSRKFKIVSPVVSFLVRRPKSRANLIDPANENGLREKRSAEIAESHEIHYQYRKLWWRSDEKDELEKSAEESLQNQHLQFAALTGFPLSFSRKLENSEEKVCLALPGGVVNGRVKLAENEEFSIVGEIRKFKLMSVTIRINEETIKVTNTSIIINGKASTGHPTLRIEDNLVHFSPKEAKSSYTIHRLGRRLDLSAEIDLEETNGFLPSLLEVESLLLEEITEKHKTAMLWVHGKHLLAHREENCWKLDAEQVDSLFA